MRKVKIEVQRVRAYTSKVYTGRRSNVYAKLLPFQPPAAPNDYHLIAIALGSIKYVCTTVTTILLLFVSCSLSGIPDMPASIYRHCPYAFGEREYHDEAWGAGAI